MGGANGRSGGLMSGLARTAGPSTASLNGGNIALADLDGIAGVAVADLLEIAATKR